MKYILLISILTISSLLNIYAEPVNTEGLTKKNQISIELGSNGSFKQKSILDIVYIEPSGRLETEDLSIDELNTTPEVSITYLRSLSDNFKVLTGVNLNFSSTKSNFTMIEPLDAGLSEEFLFEEFSTQNYGGFVLGGEYNLFQSVDKKFIVFASLVANINVANVTLQSKSGTRSYTGKDFNYSNTGGGTGGGDNTGGGGNTGGGTGGGDNTGGGGNTGGGTGGGDNGGGGNTGGGGTGGGDNGGGGNTGGGGTGGGGNTPPTRSIATIAVLAGKHPISRGEKGLAQFCRNVARKAGYDNYVHQRVEGSPIYTGGYLVLLNDMYCIGEADDKATKKTMTTNAFNTKANNDYYSNTQSTEKLAIYIPIEIGIGTQYYFNDSISLVGSIKYVSSYTLSAKLNMENKEILHGTLIVDAHPKFNLGLRYAF